ncbi:MAG TPA: TonB-dependent receptor [Pyrinomonadaceae bacterium]|nr:TonB-dependent receptor [Pyrinomonadaceae bacterium]
MKENNRYRAFAQSFIFSITLLLLIASSASAQTETARLQGTVTDPQGAAVAGATVTVTDLTTNRVVTVQADEDGAYTVPALPPSRYRIEVGGANFKTTRQEVTLEVQQVAVIDFKLEIGAVSEVVQVTDEAPLVDAATSAIGEVIQGRQIVELPLNGRNLLELATLTPGVTRGQADSDASGARGNAETFRGGNTGGAVLVVNGLRPQANNYLLDGLDNNETLVNTISIFPQAEAVQEFRVQTSVSPAEFGRAGGGVINTVIRSGRNDFFGSGFIFIRNDNLDARPTFNSRREEFRRGQFGATFGGPLIVPNFGEGTGPSVYKLRDRVFFFVDYQGLRQFLPLGRDLATVPTEAFRRGDFSALLNPALSGLAAPIQLRDPLTGAPIPGNRLDLLPGNRLNPVGLNYLNAFPLPNRAGVGILQNYENTRVQTLDEDTFDLRIDSNLNGKNQLFGRISWGRDILTTTSRLTTLPAGFGSGDNFNRNKGIAIGLTSSFTDTLYNELRLGAHRVFFGYTPPFQDQRLSASLGIPGANPVPELGGGALIGGFNNQLEYSGDFGPYLIPQNTFQINDVVSYTTGNHTLRFGGTVIRRDVSLYRPNRGKGYFFLFGNGDNPASTGFEQSDLLIGFVDNYQVGPPFGFVGTRTYEDAVFIQDDWRVTPRLTLNLGLRYDIYTNPVEQYNRQTNFDLATGRLLLAGANGNSRSLVDNDYNNFGPRVGFAYNVGGEGRTVIRGGYGLFYFLDRGGIDNQLAQNAPFSGFSQFNYSGGFRITLSGRCPNNTQDSRLCTGPLPTGDVSSIDLNNPQNISVFSVQPDIETSAVHQFNVQVQRQLTEDTVIDVGYVGTRGRNLATYFNLNRQLLGQPSGTRLFPSLGDVNVRDDNGRSRYDSLQVQLERRFARGLQYIASYTWSKAKDNSPGAFDNVGYRPQDPQNIELEYGNSNLDIPHRFVFSWLYEIPFGRGRRFGSDMPGALNFLIGGLQLNGIFNYQSGQVFNVIARGAGPDDVRVDLISDPFENVPAGRFFNPAAFANPPSVGGVFARVGTLPRNALRGPSFKTLNLGLAKNFLFNEQFRTTLRAEFFNITNTPQFSTPNTDISNGAAFGTFQTTRLGTNRQVQLGLRVEF